MFKFTRQAYGTEIEHRILDEDITWPELLEHFYEFVKGCGYYMDREEFGLEETTTSNDALLDSGHFDSEDLFRELKDRGWTGKLTNQKFGESMETIEEHGAEKCNECGHIECVCDDDEFSCNSFGQCD